MIIVSSAYLGPVQYYAHLYAADRVVEDRHERYVKQTYRNRCYIATPQGPLALTVPVVRDGAAHAALRDIRLSDHGNWRHQHWTALASAYDSSPYFVYYADDLRPLYEERRFDYLADFNEALEHVVLDWLGLSPALSLATALIDAAPDGALDLREAISPKAPAGSDPLFCPVPYYQVFAQRTGFLPNLSIADLLFNMGPESRLVLKHSLRARP